MAEDVVETIRKYTQQGAAAPAPKGVNPEDWQTAHAEVGAAYGPQEDTLYDTYNTIQDTLNRDVSTQQRYGEVADQKMANIGQQLHSQLQEGVATTGKIFEAGGQKVGGIYDELLSTIGIAGDEVVGAVGSEANRLGQQQTISGYGNPLQRIQGQIGVMKSRAATAKAGSVANIVELGAQMQSIAEQGVASADKHMAQKRADLVQNIQFAITQLQNQAMKDSASVFKQLTSLAKSKGNALQSALSQLQSARSKAEAEAAQRAVDNAFKQANLTLKIQELMMKQDPNSLDNQIKQTRLTRLQQLTGEKEGGAGGSSSPTELQGQYGVDLWSESAGLDDDQYTAINSFMRGVEGEAAEMDDQPYGYGVNLVQQFLSLTKDKDRQKFVKAHPSMKPLVDAQVDSNDVITALQIYTGRYGGRTNMVIP